MSRQIARWLPRSARLGLIVCLFLTSFILPAAASAATTATVAEQLNLRSGPGLSYRVLTIMPAGATVQITGEESEGWYPVRYNELNGWAYSQYITVGAAGAPAAPSSGVRGTATVVTSLLNLRSGPGTSFGVVAQLPYGTTVEIVGGPQAGDGRSWVEVVAKGRGQGWVAAEYLDAGETPGGAAQAPPAPTPAPTPAPASSGNQIIDIITAAANRYGQSPSAMIAVARCESGLNPKAYNARSGASGLFQFLPGTWRTTPYASSDIFDAYASANAAAWMWSVGRRGEWVC